MADLRPIGSEKLTGQDKINRIMEIARFKETIPQAINETAKSEYSVNLADGNNYQIVKERQGYIIKKTISESETEYIEPMKNRKYYSSYSQAFKRLNLVAGELNRINENEEGLSLYGEQKKFVLKTPKAEAPAAPPAAPPAPMAPPSEPPAVPSPELPPSPMDGGEDMGMDDMEPESDVEDVDVDIDVDSEKEGDNEEHVTFKSIQKLTGKLTQKIRTLDSEEGMTSEDIKYVINMVISALDLKSLSDEDKEDIMSKFEEDSEDMGGEDMGGLDLGGDDMEGEDMTDDSEVEDIQADMDVPVESEMDEEDYGNGAIFDSIFGESKVDKVISKYFEVSKKEIREQKEKNVQQTLKKKSEIKKIMESVVKMTETIEQELAAKKFLQENLDSKFIGITNKKNLVFENKGGQVRISPNGDLL
jgi:flagellar motor protein MotB